MIHAPIGGTPVYHLRQVIKERRSDAMGFRLVIPELTIHAGEQVALIGESGSGKSTLLDILAMVLQPDAAERFYLGGGEQAVDIADDAWIGCAAVILRGVSIGAGAIVGAGSVVSENVAERTVVSGNPAPTIAPAPIDTPRRMTAAHPIQASSAMSTACSPRFTFAGWPPEMI